MVYEVKIIRNDVIIKKYEFTGKRRADKERLKKGFQELHPDCKVVVE